jgi:hypothetical protein
MFRHSSEREARLQPPNRAKAAISIIKTVLTTANVRYTSLGEDGTTFIGLPPHRCRENHPRKYSLRLIQRGTAKLFKTRLKPQRPDGDAPPRIIAGASMARHYRSAPEDRRFGLGGGESLAFRCKIKPLWKVREFFGALKGNGYLQRFSDLSCLHPDQFTTKRRRPRGAETI